MCIDDIPYYHLNDSLYAFFISTDEQSGGVEVGEDKYSGIRECIDPPSGRCFISHLTASIVIWLVFMSIKATEIGKAKWSKKKKTISLKDPAENEVKGSAFFSHHRPKSDALIWL